MGYYGGWGMMGWFGGIMMILFWVALVLLVVWFARTASQAQRLDDGDVARDLLRRRFAAGEISQAEYEQARRILDREATPAGAGGQR